MTFNWTKEPYKVDGVFVLRCYHTRPNGHPFCKIILVDEDDIDDVKRKVEASTKALDNGAWEETEDAVWTYKDGKTHIEDKYIRKIA